jgi:hypothetical protein
LYNVSLPFADVRLVWKDPVIFLKVIVDLRGVEDAKYLVSTSMWLKDMWDNDHMIVADLL